MDFSVSFQLRLLVLFYTDKEFYFLSKDLVKVEFFNSVFCQWLFKFLEIYVNLYKALPTKVVVEQELLSNSDLIELPEEAGLVQEFLQLLVQHDKAELQYVKDQFVKFAKSRSIKHVLSEVSEYIDDGDFEELFTNLKTESRKFDILNVKDRDDELFSLANLKEIYENKGGIKTGISLIDNVVGGLSPRQLSIVLADTNVGKSLCLSHMGGSAVRQLRKVLHVTLEMSFARTLARYYANLSDDEDDISYQQIINFDPPDKVLHYVHDCLRERYSGCLDVVDFPSGKCTIQNLYSLLDSHPDTELFIVDYLQLLKPIKNRSDIRFDLSDLATALRGMASECNIHVASAAQANRTAHKKRVVGIDKAAEDYGIFRIADIGIGMGQNKEDELKHEAVLNIARSRDSEKGIMERYFIDFKRMRLLFRRQEIMGSDSHG